MLSVMLSYIPLLRPCTLEWDRSESRQESDLVENHPVRRGRNAMAAMRLALLRVLAVASLAAATHRAQYTANGDAGAATCQDELRDDAGITTAPLQMNKIPFPQSRRLNLAFSPVSPSEAWRPSSARQCEFNGRKLARHAMCACVCNGSVCVQYVLARAVLTVWLLALAACACACACDAFNVRVRARAMLAWARNACVHVQYAHGSLMRAFACLRGACAQVQCVSAPAMRARVWYCTRVSKHARPVYGRAHTMRASAMRGLRACAIITYASDACLRVPCVRRAVCEACACM
eukprot:6199455-Pleurochrysis_carterae.AAC.5